MARSQHDLAIRGWHPSSAFPRQRLPTLWTKAASCLLVLWLSGCGASEPSSPAAPPGPSATEQRLWETAIQPLLAESTWSARDRYDAGLALMVPLHAAFERDWTSWQDAYGAYFAEFAKANAARPVDDVLNRMQFDYLAAEFLVLAATHGRPELVPASLPDELASQVHAWWATVPAPQWARTPFTGGIQERIEWKLQVQSVAKTYYRAIVDQDWFTLALAADLRRYELASGRRLAPTQDDLDEILNLARAVFAQRVTWRPDGGWLCDVGAWTDHPDYAYAGQTEMIPGMAVAPVPGIAPDASHFSRMPLWLQSLRGAARTPGEGRYYDQLRRGLARQFLLHILMPPTLGFRGFRMSNFTDGRNGIYRWQYATLGPDNGYGPYQLSGTFTLGWWGFLEDRRIAEDYAEQATDYPLTDTVLATYVGPNTSRDRNPLLAIPGAYLSGQRELLSLLTAGR